jgi:hypothetical protein
VLRFAALNYDVWYKRTSSPGKRKNHLAWSLNPQLMDTQYVESAAEFLELRDSGDGD